MNTGLDLDKYGNSLDMESAIDTTVQTVNFISMSYDAFDFGLVLGE
jgi:hypothetical protein